MSKLRSALARLKALLAGRQEVCGVCGNPKEDNPRPSRIYVHDPGVNIPDDAPVEFAPDNRPCPSCGFMIVEYFVPSADGSKWVVDDSFVPWWRGQKEGG